MFQYIGYALLLVRDLPLSVFSYYTIKELPLKPKHYYRIVTPSAQYYRNRVQKSLIRVGTDELLYVPSPLRPSSQPTRCRISTDNVLNASNLVTASIQRDPIRGKISYGVKVDELLGTIIEAIRKFPLRDEIEDLSKEPLDFRKVRY